MLRLNRLDGVAISEPAFIFYSKKHNEDYAIPLYLNTKYNYIYGSNLVKSSLAEEICTINNKLIETNYLKKILKHY